MAQPIYFWLSPAQKSSMGGFQIWPEHNVNVSGSSRCSPISYLSMFQFSKNIYTKYFGNGGGEGGVQNVVNWRCTMEDRGLRLRITVQCNKQTIQNFCNAPTQCNTTILSIDILVVVVVASTCHRRLDEPMHCNGV